MRNAITSIEAAFEAMEAELKANADIVLAEPKLGEAGQCQDCEGIHNRVRVGKHVICPYNQELYNKEILACLCDECANTRRLDV